MFFLKKLLSLMHTCDWNIAIIENGRYCGDKCEKCGKIRNLDYLITTLKNLGVSDKVIEEIKTQKPFEGNISGKI